MIRYPKIPRLVKALPEIPQEWSSLQVVIEEKLDGANVGVSFDQGQLRLQSRGHILRGGVRERQFDRFKQWGWAVVEQLQERLGDRYLMYGEWLYAKNRAYYDALPGYFVGFDIYDKQEELFLTTPRRAEFFTDLVPAVPTLGQGLFRKVHNYEQFIGPSHFKTSEWRLRFAEACRSVGLDPGVLIRETDDSILMEGICVRVEDGEKVIGRMKLHRLDFEKVRTDDSQWLRRPIIPNMLRGVPGRQKVS